ncbi:unnamed protein product [Effrenium voratum]|nr:unnamed protein product [Effrenium voratum]
MQPRSRAERQREAAAVAAIPSEETIQKEWNAQRELHLQNRLLCLLGGCLSIEGDLTEFAKPRGRALERFRDKEKEALPARNA